MIQGIDEISHIFTHIAVDVIWAFQQIRSLVDQIGSQDSVNQSLFVCPVEFLESVGKQSKGCCGKDALCLTVF